MKPLQILNLGAGVQSTTLYLMSMRCDEPEHVPVFDYAIFADTQEEPQAVYEHLQWLKSLGGPPILEGSAGSLGDHLIRGVNSTDQNNHLASIPAYTLSPEGKIGITRRQCTAEYKVDVIERLIRSQLLGVKKYHRVPEGVRVVQYLGLSYDEAGRVARVKGRFESVYWSDARFPLFDLEMTRRDCAAYLKKVAQRVVPRSACTFCPYKSNTEWRALRDHDPAGWNRACEVDDGMRAFDALATQGLHGTLFVHRSCVPLRDAKIDTPESRGEQHLFGFAQECEGMCGV